MLFRTQDVEFFVTIPITKVHWRKNRYRWQLAMIYINHLYPLSAWQDLYQMQPNSLITPPTWTRQNCLVLSMLAVWRQLVIRRHSFVLSRQSFQFEFCLIFQFATVKSQIHCGLVKTWKLKAGSRQDKIVLSCLRLCLHRRHRQVLSVSAEWTSYNRFPGHIFTKFQQIITLF